MMSDRVTFLVTWGAASLSLIAGVAGWFAPTGMSNGSQVALAILLAAATLWITEAVPLFVTSFIILLLSTTWLVPTM